MLHGNEALVIHIPVLVATCSGRSWVAFSAIRFQMGQSPPFPRSTHLGSGHLADARIEGWGKDDELKSLDSLYGFHRRID